MQIRRQRLREGGQLSKVTVAAQVCVTATPRVGGSNGKTPSEGWAENSRSWCFRVIVGALPVSGGSSLASLLALSPEDLGQCGSRGLGKDRRRGGGRPPGLLAMHHRCSLEGGVGGLSCSKNKNKLSKSGESQDFERRESPLKSPRTCAIG